MKNEIKKKFEDLNLGNVREINQIADWKDGSRFIVYTGIFKNKGFMVYFIKNEIVTIRNHSGKIIFEVVK